MGKRLLLNEAAKHLGVTTHYLRTEIKGGRMPYLMAGNRYIVDLELAEETLRNRAIGNMKPKSEINQYGVIRKLV